jgi:hypothetical protein
MNCALAVALLASMVSTASAGQLKTDYDHEVDFSKYHTYSWGKVTTKNPFFVDRIKHAVDASLQAKGWQLVPSGGQSTIFAVDQVHNQQELDTMYAGMGGGWGRGRFGGMGGMGGMGDATTTTVDVKVGKLVVDVFDSQSKALLWRGSAAEELSDNSDKNSKKLADDIGKLLKNFPPKKK